MTTLKDVAKMAGVSVSTVSYVMNGKKTVRPETLQRIEDAFKKLDYCPNLLASSLKTNQSRTVGVVVSDFQNLYFVQLLKELEKELSMQNYCMIVCDADNSPRREMECLKRLLSRNIDGLILIGTGKADYSALEKRKVPIVCIDRYSGGELVTVKTDDVLGGTMGTEYLLARGYQKILFVGMEQYQFAEERYQGYHAAMRAAGKKESRLEVPGQEESGKAFKQAIQNGLFFDAVFCCTDYLAAGALKALAEKGISVPGEVGVLGYDNVNLAEWTVPELTTVAQPKAELGTTAVQCMMKMIKGEILNERKILLPPWIEERRSC